MENKKGQNGRITINDVSKAAGVSKTTVSHYLNGRYEFMSDETKQRIAQIIEDLHYQPTMAARTLKSKRSRMIGIISNTLKYSVGSQTIVGIRDICEQNGYSTIVYSTRDNPEVEQLALQNCIDQQVEGIVIIPSTQNVSLYRKIYEQGTPLVLCTRQLPGWPYASATVRHDKLITEMNAHLIENGYEKILLLLDDPTWHKVWMTEQFVQSSIPYTGMNRAECLAWVGNSPTLVQETVKHFMDAFPKERKAVFAINTHLLFLLLRELSRMKIEIPAELGVCGYDVMGWSELVPPGITSINQPMQKMGKVAAEQLFEIIRGNATDAVGPTYLEGEIFLRASTANIKKKS